MTYAIPSGLKRIAETLRETASDYAGRASDIADRAGGEARERREDARDELRRLWSQMEDLVENRLRPAAEDASRYARRRARDAAGYAGEGRELALDAADRLRGATRSHPLLAIGIAVATTWIVASLLNSRR